MEDDTIVLIVGDQEHDFNIKEEVLDEELLNEEYILEIDLKNEIQPEQEDEEEDDEEYEEEDEEEEEDKEVSEEEYTEKVTKNNLRKNKSGTRKADKPTKNELVTEPYLSIEELQMKYPEFEEDEESLVYYVSEMMRNTRPQNAPTDAFSLVEDDLLQCAYCEDLHLTYKKAEKHYQEKHGPKYCKCFSCGAEYRSIGPLYRHEREKCLGPHRGVVLRARALALNNKVRQAALCADLQRDVAKEAAQAKVPKPPQKRPRNMEVEQSYLSVEELKAKYPKLAADETALVHYLAEMMKNVETPPVPPGAYYREGDTFVCRFCLERHKLEKKAKYHYQERHGTRFCQCYGCGVSYRMKGILYKHEKVCKSSYRRLVLRARDRAIGGRARIDRNNLPPRRAHAKYLPRESKHYQCKQCPAAFVTGTGLRSHERLHAGERPHVCDKCGNKYTSRSALYRHREHHDGRKYECDLCGGRFKFKSGVAAHMATHTGVKPYPCSFKGCDRSFSSRVILSAHHNKIHLRLPPQYACQICPKRFTRTLRLKHHMRAVHGMQLMTRHMFFKTLPRLTDEEVMAAKVVIKEPLVLD